MVTLAPTPTQMARYSLITPATPGIGLGVDSNIGATANGPLGSMNAVNAAFDQKILHLQSAGTSDYVLYITTAKFGLGIDAHSSASTGGVGLIEIATNQGGQNAIFLNDDNTNSGSGSASISVDKDGNNGSAIYGLYLDVVNAGAGQAHALGIAAGSVSLADGVNIIPGLRPARRLAQLLRRNLACGTLRRLFSQPRELRRQRLRPILRP
jgi:hypothetical protein